MSDWTPTKKQLPPNALAGGMTYESVNQYGTPVTVLTCTYCGRTVTICPALSPERLTKWGTGCLTPDCSSYDITRDMDIFFDALIEHGQIGRATA